jgi:hypothetical protein
MDQANLLNTGIISCAPVASRARREQAKRTFIVTGIARSGTSLIASLLKEAGVFMGAFLHNVVNEDAQILEVLRRRDMETLKTLVRNRNAENAQWGFKVPNLHAYLKHTELGMFRNPHLLVIYRDPVAVAVRNALSEHYSEVDALVNSANAMHSMAQFARRAECPVLLLSYEKALSLPNTMIERVLEFCGLALHDADRARLLMQVQPNRPEYLAASTSSFEGRIDGVFNGELYGWCWQTGRLEPVRLQVFADDRPVATVVADAFREDLMHAGVGNGCHGFFVPIARHGVRRSAVIRVKISNRVLELENSGMALGALPEMVSGG